MSRGSFQLRLLLVTVFAVLIGAIAMTRFGQFLLYHPTRVDVDGLIFGGWQKAQLNVAPKVRLNGVVRPPTDDRAPWLLYFGGNAMGINSLHAILTQIRGTAPWGLASFAYRSYDGSTGTPSEQVLFSDAEAQVRYLSEQYGLLPENLIIFGQSLGSGVAAHLAMRLSQLGTQPLGLVLLSPYTSIRRVFDEQVPWLPVGWVSPDTFATGEIADDIKAPVLVIHGKLDTLISIQHSYDLMAIFKQRGQLLELPNRAHNDLWADHATIPAIRNFIAQGAAKR